MNFTILALLIIFVLGLFFRIIPYDNVQGLWNDEYVSWFISQKPLVFPFVHAIFEQCHMPLYYMYLKFVTYIFGNSDVILRLSSLITGIFGIVVMYFVGKTKNTLVAVLCSLFTAISGILIYFSYEVRPYSLIFLFSALSLLFTIKLLENSNKRNLIFYILANCAILFTHTIGFVYVLCNFWFVADFLKNKKPEFTKKISLSIGIVFLLLTPLILNIFTTSSYSQWWSRFSVSKLLFLFTDLFSNYLVNIVNAPNNFMLLLNIKYIIFGVIPALICVLAITNTLISKDKTLIKLSLTAFVPIIILFITSVSGKLVFLTKYNFEVYPVLIYLAMIGLCEFKNKRLKISLIISLFLLNICFLFTNDFNQKFYKSESNKLVAELLLKAKLNPDDIILFTYYPRERFLKYFDYSDYEIREVHKGNFFYYLTPNTTYSEAVTDGAKIYKNLYLSNDNKHFNSRVEEEFYQNLTSGKKIAVIFLNSVSMLSDIQLYQIASNDKYYNKTPQMYMIFSYVRNFLIKKMYTDLKIIKYEQKGDWSMIVFEKP